MPRSAAGCSDHPAKRGLRRRDGAVDVSRVAGGNGGEELLGGGVGHVEHAAPGGLDPRPVDIEVAVLVHDNAGYVTRHQGLAESGHRMTGFGAHDGIARGTKTPTYQRSRDMAGMVAPIPDERAGLLAYLEQQRYVIKLTASA